MKVLPVHFDIVYELEDGKLQTVPFFIFNTPYAKSWLNLWKNASVSETLTSWHKKSIDNEKDMLITECNRLSTALNASENTNLPTVSNLNFDVFNHLHYVFEQQLPQNPSNSLWSDLNIAIHKLENILMHEQTNAVKKLLSVVNHTNMYDKIEIQNEWATYQVINASWGDLIAGYATTGKNWLDTFATNDLELLRLNAVKTQKHIMAEFYTCYEFPDSGWQLDPLTAKFSDMDLKIKFLHWKSRLPVELRSNVPDNCEHFCLGKYILGRINLHALHRYFPKFDKTQFNTDRNFRLEWFKFWHEEFFNQIKHVSSIKCYENNGTISPVLNFNPRDFRFRIDI